MSNINISKRRKKTHTIKYNSNKSNKHKYNKLKKIYTIKNTANKIYTKHNIKSGGATETANLIKNYGNNVARIKEALVNNIKNNKEHYEKVIKTRTDTTHFKEEEDALKTETAKLPELENRVKALETENENIKSFKENGNKTLPSDYFTKVYCFDNQSKQYEELNNTTNIDIIAKDNNIDSTLKITSGKQVKKKVENVQLYKKTVEINTYIKTIKNSKDPKAEQELRSVLAKHRVLNSRVAPQLIKYANPDVYFLFVKDSTKDNGNAGAEVIIQVSNKPQQDYVEDWLDKDNINKNLVIVNYKGNETEIRKQKEEIASLKNKSSLLEEKRQQLTADNEAFKRMHKQHNNFQNRTIKINIDASPKNVDLFLFEYGIISKHEHDKLYNFYDYFDELVLKYSKQISKILLVNNNYNITTAGNNILIENFETILSYINSRIYELFDNSLNILMIEIASKDDSIIQNILENNKAIATNEIYIARRDSIEAWLLCFYLNNEDKDLILEKLKEFESIEELKDHTDFIIKQGDTDLKNPITKNLKHCLEELNELNKKIVDIEFISTLTVEEDKATGAEDYSLERDEYNSSLKWDMYNPTYIKVSDKQVKQDKQDKQDVQGGGGPQEVAAAVTAVSNVLSKSVVRPEEDPTEDLIEDPIELNKGSIATRIKMDDQDKYTLVTCEEYVMEEENTSFEVKIHNNPGNVFIGVIKKSTNNKDEPNVAIEGIPETFISPLTTTTTVRVIKKKQSISIQKYAGDQTQEKAKIINRVTTENINWVPAVYMKGENTSVQIMPHFLAPPPPEPKSIPIIWTNIKGSHFVANGEMLEKKEDAYYNEDRAEDEWDSEATSVEEINEWDGNQGVVWTCDKGNKGFIIGLSNAGADKDGSGFGLYCSADKKLYIVNNLSTKDLSTNTSNSVGEYNEGAKFEVRVKGDSVTFYRILPGEGEEELPHTYKTPPKYPLRVYCRFKTPGAKAKDVNLKIKDDETKKYEPNPEYSTITWDNENVDYGNCKKVRREEAWVKSVLYQNIVKNSLEFMQKVKAPSTSEIKEEDNIEQSVVWKSFRGDILPEKIDRSEVTIGLSNKDQNSHNYIDFGIRLYGQEVVDQANRAIEIVGSGEPNKNIQTHYFDNDEFEVRVIGKKVSCHHNGNLLHTFTKKEVKFPLVVRCELQGYYDGAIAQAKDVRLKKVYRDISANEDSSDNDKRAIISAAAAAMIEMKKQKSGLNKNAESPEKWTKEQVADWLRGINTAYSKYCKAFIDNGINGVELLSNDLGLDELKEFGVASPDEKKHIMEEIAKLKKGVDMRQDEAARKERERHEQQREAAKEQERKEAEEKERKEAEEKARKAAEEKARKEAEEKARKAAASSQSESNDIDLWLTDFNISSEDSEAIRDKLKKYVYELADFADLEDADEKELIEFVNQRQGLNNAKKQEITKALNELCGTPNEAAERRHREQMEQIQASHQSAKTRVINLEEKIFGNAKEGRLNERIEALMKAKNLSKNVYKTMVNQMAALEATVKEDSGESSGEEKLTDLDMSYSPRPPDWGDNRGRQQFNELVKLDSGGTLSIKSEPPSSKSRSQTDVWVVSKDTINSGNGLRWIVPKDNIYMNVGLQRKIEIPQKILDLPRVTEGQISYAKAKLLKASNQTVPKSTPQYAILYLNNKKFNIKDNGEDVLYQGLTSENQKTAHEDAMGGAEWNYTPNDDFAIKVFNNQIAYYQNRKPIYSSKITNNEFKFMAHCSFLNKDARVNKISWI
uniref:SAM domain protein n=1 Tax=Megaviridae environmental sample TaxID=1737588 RepID=A0A5J6VM44_9VIRU|nr:MAG: SAM domain protein [Megaviridae environmental sample]